MTENGMESRTLPVCFSLVRTGLRPVPLDETGDATHLPPQRHGRPDAQDTRQTSPALETMWECDKGAFSVASRREGKL